MNLTRRILSGEIEHVFTYEDNTYPVRSLILFCKGRTPENVKLQTFKRLMTETKLEDVWGLYHSNTKSVESISLMDLVDHVQRIQIASLRYPIIVFKDKDKVQILDGLHRLIKSYVDNQKTISVVYLSPEDMTEFTTGC